MQSQDVLMNLLTSVGFRLPVLIALGVALVMTLDTPKGRIRSVALWGLVILMVVQVVGGLASATPLLLIASGDFGALSAVQGVLGVVHFVVALLTAVGFIALAWALVQALRGQRVPPQ